MEREIFEKYLKKLEIEIELNPDEPTLKYLTRKHSTKIMYQNLELLEEGLKEKQTRDFVSLKFTDLYEDLLVKKKGGFCFQLNCFLHYVLLNLKYEIHQVKATIYNDFPTHSVLIVDLNEKLYLIDVGFGYNSLMEPVLLPKEEGEFCFSLYEDNYKIKYNNEIYTLEIKINEEFMKMYSFKNDQKLDISDISQFYKEFLVDERMINIRDEYVKIGGLYDGVRTGVYGLKSKKKLVYTKVNIDKHEIKVNELKDILLNYDINYDNLNLKNIINIFK
jgi:arylamine N-acetyltransferase